MEKREVFTGFAITVVDKGFVYVGDVECGTDWCVIQNAMNLRRWGTTKGLGELALCGPNENTVMDKVGTIRVPMHALISIIDTEKVKWNI